MVAHAGAVPGERVEMIYHTIDASAQEHKCQLCRLQATHKISEAGRAEPTHTTDRHPFTAFLCCVCFGECFGEVAKVWCWDGVLK